MSLESVLEPDGYRFVKASSGRQVLKLLLTDFDFALILMDVQMPNLNGFETAALIYERDKLRHIPIIFITANNYGEENLFRGYRAGAVETGFEHPHQQATAHGGNCNEGRTAGMSSDQ